MNKFAGIFQSSQNDASSEEARPSPAPPPDLKPVITPPPEPVKPAAKPAMFGNVGTGLRQSEPMLFERARSLLQRASGDTLNAFLKQLQDPNMPADDLRSTLETLIEFRTATSLLTRAAEDALFSGARRGAPSLGKPTEALT